MRIPIDRRLLRASGTRLYVAPARGLYVYYRNSTIEVPVYTASYGGTVRSQPLVADAEAGFPNCWVEPGFYDLHSPEDTTNPTKGWDAAPGIDTSEAFAGIATKGRGKPAKLRLANEFTRPRAVGLTGWAADYHAGATGTAFTEVSDADLGNCTQLAATHAGAFTDTVKIGDPLATYGVPILADQLVFGRATVKIVDAPGPVDVFLIQYSGNTAESTTRLRTVALWEDVAEGEIVELEGFDLAVAVAGFVRYQVAVSGTAGTISFRVGKPQTVVEPETDVPSYGDGTTTDWGWLDAADASISIGWAKPTDLGDMPRGFNDYWGFHLDGEVSAADHADLLAESGMTHLRFGPIDLDDAWPSEGADLDWTATPYAEWFEEFRKRGLKVMPVIARSTYWQSTVADPNVTTITRVDPDFFDQWVRTWQSLVLTWPDVIDSVEFGNEINSEGSDAAGPVTPEDPADFVAAMEVMRDGLKAVRPDIKFVGSGYMSVSSAGPGTELYDYLTALFTAGMGGLLDELTIHPYFPDEVKEVGTGGPASVSYFWPYFYALAIARRVLAEQNEDIPIGITECGLWNTQAVTDYFEREQAQTVLLLRGMAARAGMSRFFVHSLMAFEPQNAVAETMALVEPVRRRRKQGFHWLRRGRSHDADWVPFTLLNSWVPFAGVYPLPSYRMDDEGRVWIRGAAKSGSSATAVIGTLPEGYRPQNRIDLPVTGANAGYAYLMIAVSGDVSTPAGGATTFNEITCGPFLPGR